ncbi:hypothetical protein [Aliidiomarina quisquiliarum]|uniref:hypothetical protein n=1 Tax=Aliidiomarina quisquiliarum TaxID=2938947 RepID=UPI00208F7181|nr:hypothetical protein [Aliidiomarina quisquiliarum]MCO4320066.1 hypothetical protein [Aliidiomarina quisquiliarum]
MRRTKNQQKITNGKESRRLPRSVHILGWTLIASAALIFGLPIMYDIYLSVTPALDSHLEQKTQALAEQSAIIFGLAILILGVLLAVKRWRWERKRARLKAMVREYQLRKHAKNRKNKQPRKRK